MVRIRLYIVFFAVLAVASPSWADDAVQVRASAKDDYTRIVFEWPKAPSYVTDKSTSQLTLKFQSAAAFKTEGAAPTSLPRITSYQTPDTKTAVIGFTEGQDVRHFEIGNKIIVDIRGPSSAKKNVEPEKKVEAAPIPVPAVPVTKVEKIEPATPSTVAPVAKATEKAPEQKIEETKEPITNAAVGDAVIQVNSTSALGLAVFKRSGNLWIIIDQPDYPLPPQITGTDAKKFGTFEKIPLKESTAFRLALPDARNFHVEGGGLSWKIVSGNVPAPFKPTEFKRNSAEGYANIVWPIPSVRRIIDVNDPVVGDTLKVATVDAAKYFSGEVHEYAQFGTLSSYAGLAIESRIDDLDVKKTAEGVVIGSPNGLAVSPETDTAFLSVPESAKPAVAPTNVPTTATPASAETASTQVTPVPVATPKATDKTQLFRLNDWRMGNDDAIEDSRRILMSGMKDKDEQGKAQDLLTLAKMELSHGRGPEAKGYLELAQQFVPDLSDTPEYTALHGAATAMSGQFEEALKDFNSEALKPLQEMALWRAYSLAGLEDWRQASDVLPADFSNLQTYPAEVKTPVALALTEVALRDGDLKKAGSLMQIAEGKDMLLPYKAALDYMKGEALRQEGKIDDAEKTWAILKDGKDDLYRAKAGLALTTLQMDKKKIKPTEAIDRLEGLRYAWRGDELETSVNYKLGQIYIANNNPLKGLSLLKQATALSPQSDQSKKISAEMVATFASLFEPNRIKDINPVDAISLYSEFSSLAPAGPAGDKLVRQLADRLVDADLLPRAASILQTQVDSGKLSGAEGAATAIRLASIYLQDSQMDKALTALGKAEEFMLQGDLRKSEPGLSREIDILRAEILGAQKKPEEAFIVLARLDQNQDVIRLRADIAWKNQRWQDAADSLEVLVEKMEISPSRPANEEDASLLLNWAVALYLADNRTVLSNVREKYTTAMSGTARADQFEVVTRPRQSALLADRDTINSIIEETDIFKGFVDSSNASNAKSAAANAKPQQAAQEIAPVAPAKPPTTVE